MLSELLVKHIETISSKIKEGLIVYKGFSFDFLNSISDEYPFVNDPSIIFNDKKLDLKNLSNNKAKVIKQFLTLTGTKIATFEEFTLLCHNINPDILEYNITIFNNNFFNEWYPNSSNEEFPDLMKEVDENNTFEMPKTFNQFYTNSQTIKGNSWISYFDLSIDIENFEEKDFFDNNCLDQNLLVNNYNGENDVIEFPTSDSTYDDIKYKIFCGDFETNYSLLISKSNFDRLSSVLTSQLIILQYLYELKNKHFKVLILSEDDGEQISDKFKKILKRYWNSTDFRNLEFYSNPDVSNEKHYLTQEQLINSIVNQAEKSHQLERFQDIFITAPTGSGKSLLFQIPALYLEEMYNFVTIVVSPLKALMYDQVVALEKRGVTSACYINSDISFIEREDHINQINEGKKSILYLSPELLLSYNIEEFIGERKLGLLVIDEAHLVSTWGRDFRVDYWYLGKYIRRLRKYTSQNFPVVGLTATAIYGGDSDTVFQTIESLNMQNPKLFIGNVRRDEIKFEFNEFKYSGSHEEAKLNKTVKNINFDIKKGNKSIYYFPWTKQIDITSLSIDPELHNRTGRYYGSVDKFERQDVIERFKKGDIVCVLATKAFGMGVDISDIAQVYHHAPSGSLSDYIQEIGRVARDPSMQGLAKVDFISMDLKFTKILYGLSAVHQYQIKLVLNKIYEVYNSKKKQNLLFSVEDFSYIFPNATDHDSKVKSTLLLIENDLLNKYGYNVLIVRPKNLFSTVYAEIPEKIEKSFLQTFGEYCTKLNKPKLYH